MPGNSLNQTMQKLNSADFCFTPLVHEGEWAYCGEAAISKNCVLKNWGYGLTFVDYIHDRNLYGQNVVVMKKGTS
jgi:hypothetical protein